MLTPKGYWFKDSSGRSVMLRGVNLSGATKVPFNPLITSDIKDGFFNHPQVSFVGRPFPLEEADQHFTRLREWGFNCLRFLITWEAIEHKGPGEYDQEYLDYLSQVVHLAGSYGFMLFIDPHQDVWSRFSGGDGAPGWTFEAVGLDITRFQDTGAAIVHNTHGDPFPRMIWPSNYTKLAAATMFTLFFGGNRFAPNLKIEGVTVQDYLQDHYLMALCQVAKRLKGLDFCLGYDTLNEPSAGYIGWPDLNSNQTLLRIGDAPSPWQSMLLGAGIAQEVEVWKAGLTGLKKTGTRLINPQGPAWLPGRTCIWREHGVWDIDSGNKPVLLRPDYFADTDFAQEHMKPFIMKFAQAIQAEDPKAMIFYEHEVGGHPAAFAPQEIPNLVYAPHWYDGITLFLKRFLSHFTVDTNTGKLVIGRGSIARLFAAELRKYRQEAVTKLPDVPVLIGEVGIPYDLQAKKAFRTGDFSAQTRAMERSMQAVEANLLNYTLWNYTPDNSNALGDGWNGEDLSIFSPDQQDEPGDINSGGRALAAVIRPYPIRTSGTPLESRFDGPSRTYTLVFRHNPELTEPTEIYLPRYHYGQGCEIKVSNGPTAIDTEKQILRYWPQPGSTNHTVTISPKGNT